LKTDVHKIFNSDTDGYLWFVIKLNKYIILSGPRPITGLCLLIWKHNLKSYRHPRIDTIPYRCNVL